MPSPFPPTIRALAVATVFGCLSFSGAEAQERPVPNAGPVIESAGAVFEIVNPTFSTPLDHTYRVVFDVANGSAGEGRVTTGFNSVARFLNMHAQAGVPVENLDVALVVHGSAAQDLLQDSAHEDRLGFANPNTTLLSELVNAGVRIVLCGQSAMGRGVAPEALAPGVELALSAMTAHQVLQAEGYRPNPF